MKITLSLMSAASAMIILDLISRVSKYCIAQFCHLNEKLIKTLINIFFRIHEGRIIGLTHTYIGLAEPSRLRS
jgi:hypothetical protein